MSKIRGLIAALCAVLAAAEAAPADFAAVAFHSNLGRQYSEHGNYDAAQRAYARALEISESTPGLEAASFAILTNLAEVLRSEGKDAGPVFRRALASGEAAFGPDDARLANVLNNYALMEKGQRRYAAAEQLWNRALTIRTGISGADDPETATILNNLGQLARVRGDRKRARELFRSAIRIWENAPGADRLNVASGLTNLAVLLSEEKKYAEAELLHRRALSIDEARSGSDSLVTGRNLNNLGALYCLTRRYAEAEPLLGRALRIHRTAVPASPETAKVLRNLAEARNHLGAPDDAETLYREALAIWDASPDPNNPEMLPAIDGLASLVRASGRHAEAEKLSLRAMRIRVKQALSAEQSR